MDNRTKKILIIICGIVALLVVAFVIFINVINLDNTRSGSDNYAVSATEDTFPKKYVKEEAEDKPFVKGVLTETGYESEFLDLRFVAPEGWELKTQESIISEWGETAAAQVEMCVKNIEKGNSITLFAEPISIDASLTKYKDAIRITWERSGMTFAEEKPSVTFCGKSYDVLVFEIKNPSGTVKSEMYVRLEGDRLIYFMMQYLDGKREVLEPALSAFTTY